MSLRRILLEANKVADYSSPSLRAQTEEVDMRALGGFIERMTQRAVVLAHAYEVMQDGSCPHPLDAFLHASECPIINEERLSDSEFYALLPIWGRVCEKSCRADTAKNVTPGAQQAQSAGNAAPFGIDESFINRFMRGE